ncbi:hypothetical protein E2C01_061171 [Portunus trituberculatus]|uniref:Uncharacterized protein n=1 Tax=Portunus trituberculatus TaxID=210409 RepID=A0A5B7H359_PORTR|nr:hypothetical protein [Portunus trituberculatus]
MPPHGLSVRVRAYSTSSTCNFSSNNRCNSSSNNNNSNSNSNSNSNNKHPKPSLFRLPPLLTCRHKYCSERVNAAQFMHVIFRLVEEIRGDLTGLL